MENEQTEIIEHIVEIDNYLSATLKIPKKLTAIELKALMMKANKLFNLSETPLVEKRKYIRCKIRSEAEKRELVEKYEKSNDEERLRMTEEMGIGNKSLYQMIWKIKKDLNISSKKCDNESKNQYNKSLKKVVERYLETKEPIGKLLTEELGRQAGGTDYINVRKFIKSKGGQE